MSVFSVLGAGAMGTLIGYLLASNGNDVLIWARRKKICKQINEERENKEYMPGLILPERLRASDDLEECVTTSDRIVIAIPSHGIYDLCTKLDRYELSQISWLSVVKGIDSRSLLTTSQLLIRKLNIKVQKIAVLSGPNFAVEIARKLPTITVIGSKSSLTASIFRQSLQNDSFPIRTTHDMIGVEVGGILKNIGAIAAGLIDGLNLGDNIRGVIIPMYLKEALEIGTKVFGAKAETLLGPAFLGDMITTAFSNKSRNRILGLLASKCITKIPEHTFIAEGKSNARILIDFAKEYKINACITRFVYRTLEGIKPYDAFDFLWSEIRKNVQEIFNFEVALKN